MAWRRTRGAPSPRHCRASLRTRSLSSRDPSLTVASKASVFSTPVKSLIVILRALSSWPWRRAMVPMAASILSSLGSACPTFSPSVCLVIGQSPPGYIPSASKWCSCRRRSCASSASVGRNSDSVFRREPPRLRSARFPFRTHRCSPVSGVHHNRPFILPDRARWPSTGETRNAANPPDVPQTMFHRVEVRGVHMRGKVLIIADRTPQYPVCCTFRPPFAVRMSG